MGTKITQRDKIMMIVLGIVIIIALTLVLPNIGIFACRDAIAELKEYNLTLEDELTSQLLELQEMGVSKVYASSYVNAQRSLQEKIITAKREAATLAGSIMAFTKSYAVDEEWIMGLEYKYGIKSSEENKLLNIDAQISPNNQMDYTINTIKYTLCGAKRNLEYTISTYANCHIDITLVYDGFDLNSMGAFLLYMQQITSKGSILIESATYNSETATGSIVMTALMTDNDGISRYAQEIAELDAQEESNQ